MSTPPKGLYEGNDLDTSLGLELSVPSAVSALKPNACNSHFSGGLEDFNEWMKVAHKRCVSLVTPALCPTNAVIDLFGADLALPCL